MSYSCPICDYPHLDVNPFELWPPPVDVQLRPPYHEQLGAPSYEVCALCGFEFGNDDDPGDGTVGHSFESYRAHWVSHGRAVFAGGKYLRAGFDPDDHGRPPKALPPAD